MKKLLASIFACVSAATAQVYQVYPAQATPAQAPVQTQVTNVVKTQQTVQNAPRTVMYQQPQQPPMVLMNPEAFGFSSPLGFGFFPPLQFPAVQDNVNGLRLSVFVSENANVGFIDLATLASITNRDFTGFGLSGLWNHVGQNAQGIMLAGLGNSVNANVTGIQIASFINNNNEAYETRGLQLALINRAGNMNGIQLGLMNQARLMTGIQIGAINVTEYISGLQIGVVNIIRQSRVPCMILFNMGF